MPDSLPIKYAFQGFKGTWFIFIEACVWSSFEKLHLSDFKAQQIGGHILNDNDVTDTLNPGSFVTSTNKNNLKRRRKSRIPRFHCFKALILLEVLRASHFSKEKKRLKRVNKICFLNHPTKELVDGHLERKEGTSAKSRLGVSPTRQPSESSEEWNPYSHVESPTETLSESLSVSDIIKKYFSNYDEVTSASETTFGTIGKQSSELPKAITDNNCSKKNINTVPQYTPTTPRRVIVSSYLTRRRSLASNDKPKKTEVGKCLAIASSNLGISASNKRHESSICGLRQRKLSLHKYSSVVKSLVFEISDEDD